MLILASQSPRRQELLATFGIPFTVQQADLDETPLEQESAMLMTQRLATDKANHIFAKNAGAPSVRQEAEPPPLFR